MTAEYEPSRPIIKSISKSEGFLTVDIESRGREVTLKRKITDPRGALQKLFTDDVTDIILGDTQIPDGQREATLAKISDQYKQRISKKMAIKSFQ
jgi:hypothetical protein